jgi:hypothetical protein
VKEYGADINLSMKELATLVFNLMAPFYTVLEVVLCICFVLNRTSFTDIRQA